MNEAEARAILREQLREYRQKPYSHLVTLISRQESREVTAPSGTTYQLEFQVFWDDRRDGNVRVIGAIDDGGWRAFVPLSENFIKAPDDSFVGE